MANSKKLKIQMNGRSDEFFTPEYALKPLLPFLKKDWTIWECAWGEGALATHLKNKGFNVLNKDVDFFDFEEMVIQKQIEKERNLECGLYFLDRSLVDCLGMSFFQGQSLNSDIVQLIRDAGYGSRVFLLSPLEVYENDEQRKETKEEMLNIHNELRRAYIEQGFDIVEVPAMSPEERAEFILKNLHQKSS